MAINPIIDAKTIQSFTTSEISNSVTRLIGTMKSAVAMTATVDWTSRPILCCEHSLIQALSVLCRCSGEANKR